MNVQGIQFTYKVASSDTEHLYALAEGVVPGHHGAPSHIHHREDEAFYVLEGEFEIECGGESFRAGAGDFALLPKSLPHSFRNLAGNPGRLLCVQSPGGIEEFFEHLSVLGRDGGPDPEKLRDLLEKYGIEFLTNRGHFSQTTGSTDPTRNK